MEVDFDLSALTPEGIMSASFGKAITDSIESTSAEIAKASGQKKAELIREKAELLFLQKGIAEKIGPLISKVSAESEKQVDILRDFVKENGADGVKLLSGLTGFVVKSSIKNEFVTGDVKKSEQDAAKLKSKQDLLAATRAISDNFAPLIANLARVNEAEEGALLKVFQQEVQAKGPEFLKQVAELANNPEVASVVPESMLPYIKAAQAVPEKLYPLVAEVIKAPKDSLAIVARNSTLAPDALALLKDERVAPLVPENIKKLASAMDKFAANATQVPAKEPAKTVSTAPATENAKNAEVPTEAAFYLAFAPKMADFQKALVKEDGSVNMGALRQLAVVGDIVKADGSIDESKIGDNVRKNFIELVAIVKGTDKVTGKPEQIKAAQGQLVMKYFESLKAEVAKLKGDKEAGTKILNKILEGIDLTDAEGKLSQEKARAFSALLGKEFGGDEIIDRMFKSELLNKDLEFDAKLKLARGTLEALDEAQGNDGLGKFYEKRKAELAEVEKLGGTEEGKAQLNAIAEKIAEKQKELDAAKLEEKRAKEEEAWKNSETFKTQSFFIKLIEFLKQIISGIKEISNFFSKGKENSLSKTMDSWTAWCDSKLETVNKLDEMALAGDGDINTISQKDFDKAGISKWSMEGMLINAGWAAGYKAPELLEAVVGPMAGLIGLTPKPEQTSQKAK